MLFHAVMKFCLDLLRSKFWLIGDWAINYAKYCLRNCTALVLIDRRLFLRRSRGGGGSGRVNGKRPMYIKERLFIFCRKHLVCVHPLVKVKFKDFSRTFKVLFQ